jgi:hypothetical protein
MTLIRGLSNLADKESHALHELCKNIKSRPKMFDMPAKPGDNK